MGPKYFYNNMHENTVVDDYNNDNQKNWTFILSHTVWLTFCLCNLISLQP